MEGKVTLYDSNDKKIGETFARRARQLVKQQRAVWTDESQEAIRFFPDAENMDTPEDEPQCTTAKHDKELLSVAEEMIERQKWFMIHAVALIPGFVALFIAGLVVQDIFRGTSGALFIAFTFGSWITAFAAHVFYIYQTSYFKLSRAKKKKETQLAMAIAQLKEELKT
jgi:hypothetical protein